MRSSSLLPLLLAACAPAAKSGHRVDSSDTGSSADEDAPWFCADSSPTVNARDAGGYEVLTEHYDLVLEGMSEEDATDYGRMAESGWQAWSAYFGVAPTLASGELLHVGLYATEAEWEAAITADGDTPPVGAGGYYSPTSKGAYLWIQPTIYYDATLFLHEMTHQFHYLARTGNTSRPGWYVEGVAEYLSRHDWDGSCLRLGRTATLTQEDAPAQALAEIEASGLDLAGILGGASASRPVSMEIWRYLDVGDDGLHHDAWAAFRDELDADASIDVLSRFTTLLGDPATIASGLAAWLPTDQEPMTPVFVDWVHEAPGQVRSVASFFSAASVKLPTDEFDASFTSIDGTWYGGVLVSWDDSSNYTAFLVGSDGSASAFDVTGGGVSWTITGSVVASSSYALVATGAGVSVNGAPYTVATTHAPAAGLAVYGSDLDFTGIASPEP